MAAIKRDPPATIDEVNAPTRMVNPHRDYAIDHPRPKTPSAAEMAAQTPFTSEDGVRGVLAVAALEGGTFVLRLNDVSAPMRALMQLASAMGTEVEIVIRRRSAG